MCSCSSSWSNRKLRRNKRIPPSLWKWRATCAGPSRRQMGRKEPLKIQQGVWLTVFVGTGMSGVCVQESVCSVSVVQGADLTVVRHELPGFSQTTCSFLQWGERLYILKTPSDCLPRTDYTRLCSSHPSSNTQHPLQEGLPCYTPFSEGKQASDELWWGTNQTNTGVSPPRFFTPLSTASCHFSLLLSVLLSLWFYVCSHLQNQIRKSGHWMDSSSCVM